MELQLNAPWITGLNLSDLPHKKRRAIARGKGLGDLKPPPPSFCQISQVKTLSQPGGSHYPHPVLQAPRIFRPCDGPDTESFPIILRRQRFAVQRCAVHSSLVQSQLSN